MSDKPTDPSTGAEGAAAPEPKGKGKAVEETSGMSMDEDEGESSDEGGEEVRTLPQFLQSILSVFCLPVYEN